MFRRPLLLPLILCFLILGAGTVRADFKEDVVKPYGLKVNSGNRLREVTEEKAVEVLYKYFGKTEKRKIDDCKSKIVSCTEKTVSTRSMVAWYFALKNEKSPKLLSLKYPKVKLETRRAWIEARALNLITGSRLTYLNFKEFLYRSEVSKAHDGKAYYPGLVLKESEILPKNFRSPNEVTQIIKNLEADLKALTAESPSPETKQEIEKLKAYKDKFAQVSIELKRENSPLVKIPDMPEDLQAKVISLGLEEVLSEFTYDYSKNAAYRQYNMITGTEQISGKVYQPGEIVDFLKVLGEGGWGKYKNGWIIQGGAETWAFGGGLCGAATMFFIPSYKAGLEVVARTGHTIFYKSLYPVEYIGLEATVFRPSKNVQIRNSTQSPLMFYVKDDKVGKKLTLYLIGNSPYAEVKLIGPTQLDKRTYSWVRQIEKTDGTMVTEELTTRYNAIH